MLSAESAATGETSFQDLHGFRWLDQSAHRNSIWLDNMSVCWYFDQWEKGSVVDYCRPPPRFITPHVTGIISETELISLQIYKSLTDLCWFDFKLPSARWSGGDSSAAGQAAVPGQFVLLTCIRPMFVLLVSGWITDWTCSSVHHLLHV